LEAGFEWLGTAVHQSDHRPPLPRIPDPAELSSSRGMVSRYLFQCEAAIGKRCTMTVLDMFLSIRTSPILILVSWNVGMATSRFRIISGRQRQYGFSSGRSMCLLSQAILTGRSESIGQTIPVPLMFWSPFNINIFHP
jgi:hypothetical protein